MSAARDGAMRSMMSSALRRQLDDIGRQVGTPVVYLKAAWGDPFWFRLPTEPLLARAISYESASGPVLSLSPEDQILYAAVHYANHICQIDGRHLADVVRLVRARAIVWPAVMARARAAGMRLPLLLLLLLLEALRAGGADVPETLVPAPGFALRARRALCRRWIETAPALGRRRPSPDLMEYLVLRPLLSDRPSALPRVITQLMLPLLRDRLAAPKAAGSIFGSRA